MNVDSGGGFRAIWYTYQKGREVGGPLRGPLRLYRALRTKNACKTCALGMGGQHGGMVNEAGSFPEVCKKSLQAMVADMQPAIPTKFWHTNTIGELQKLTPRELEHVGRLAEPVRYRKGSDRYEPVSWDEALETISSKLAEIKPDESFWYFSGRSSNEAGFLLQLLARQYGTNNVNNCSYYCHQASGVGLSSTVGSGTATIVLEDLEKADTVFVIGGNPASNHPRLMTSLMKVRRNGGNVIVINPVIETGMKKFRVPSSPSSLAVATSVATHYIQPHIGGDLALLWGLAKAVVENGSLDQPFIDSFCEGTEDWLAAVETLSWEEIEAKSGVSTTQIKEIASVYANAEKTVFSWTMGITHHLHGVDNVQAITALAMSRGMVGRPGSGLMPIRGHSNVQGIGSVGVTPTLKKQIFDNLQSSYGLSLPQSAGMDTMACMEAADNGTVKFGFNLGGNLFGSNPDSNFAEQALANLDMNVYLSTTLNTGHVNGLADQSIILPVLARDEEPQPTTQESMFNYVRLSDGGPRRFPGPRSEIDVIAELGRRLFDVEDSAIDWSSMGETSTIRDWIAKVVPGYQRLADIDQTKEEFQIDGRTFHEPRFATETGKAQLFVHDLPELGGNAPELRLMTVRSEGQFNTVVYEEEDLYRNQQRRDIILIHPDDLSQLGLRHDQRVTVHNQTGTIEVFARSYDKIRPGNSLMYYPEANVLVPRSVDKQSRTPAFKGVVVSVEAV